MYINVCALVCTCMHVCIYVYVYTECLYMCTYSYLFKYLSVYLSHATDLWILILPFLLLYEKTTEPEDKKELRALKCKKKLV